MATEKRLIDANELWQKTFVCDEVAEVRKFIENAPTVDAVEVVRCKDCVSAAGNDVKGYMCQNQLCPCYRRDVPGDFSCTCGERRPDGVQ